MTRFARAKGSKASNEKVPEKATPWSEIKEQLIRKKEEIQFNSNKQKSDGEKLQNYKKFLEERESSDTKQTTWAEFPGVQKSHSKSKERKLKKNLKLSLDTGNAGEKINKEKSHKKKLESEAIHTNEDVECFTDKQGSDVKKIKIKKKISKEAVISEVPSVEEGVTSKSKEKKLKKLQKKQKSKENKEKGLKLVSNVDDAEVNVNNEKVHKKKKNPKNHATQTNGDVEDVSDKQNNFGKKVKNKKKFSKESVSPKVPSGKKVDTKKSKEKKLKTRQKTKLTSMTINGIHYDIEYVDGFPVKKEDAERIKLLRKQMISKGLPKSEIDRALKLERRKAEKSLAREKKKVCFNCRKYGHFLSECPEVGKKELIETSATGICFKCGSAEHTHFECKVVRGDAFKYATCFICKEQGHISKQCPDNPRGMYPRGGACKVCGEVTHLKKDCPKYQAEQQQQGDGIQAELLTNDNPDDMGDSRANVKTHTTGRLNKIIKF